MDNRTKIPISVILDMAKGEIEAFAVNCMRTNNIPPSMMVYVMKDILIDIMQMKTEQLSAEFTEMSKGDSDGNHND